ncbi:hypothetical protein, partial [Nocardia wallacei]|uniref:hypothetical protein n=1 Tax=Nocardia wallacei TaxID=480035 RepID=UPI003CC7F517
GPGAVSRRAVTRRGSRVGLVLGTAGACWGGGGVAGPPRAGPTPPHTRVMVLPGSRVSDARPGTMVMVYGDKQGDGAIVANLMMGVTLPIPGR